MTSSEIITLLQQVPPRYELVVTQGDVTHRILALSFSHMPAQVTLRLVPKEALTCAGLLFGFSRWWSEEGRFIKNEEDETRESYIKRVAEIAWSNGDYVRNTVIVVPAASPNEAVTEINGEVQRMIPDMVEFTATKEDVGGYTLIAHAYRGLATKGETVDECHMHAREAAEAFFGSPVAVRVIGPVEAYVAPAPAKRTRKPKSAPFGTINSTN